ncbi:lipocalin-like domain-containing protein [Methylobacterium soli]|uniref:Lipocalin-like domain-containing protein n=1 Tax=Methylobacterium soli TaxID=553447 RepID=A0A6L3SWX5_9HYPH|nr:lipocalin-like domain-containing protein [Methylobacterium soli]KAB1072545.1 lipocalin-like domain-containing protein [Methylobacterium soli]GJE43866.1 hypothetical protein AEGHOMDF_3045 [Methylobacterium soli]
MKRLIMSLAVISVASASFVAPEAAAQPTQDVVGTWALASVIAQQGDARTDVYGASPSGTLVLGSDGRYALIFLRNDLPKLASNNRTTGTPDENRAIASGAIAHFGTYRVDAANKALVFRIEKSTFPNWDGAEQSRSFSLSGDELTYTSPGSAGTATQIVLRRAK